MMSIQSVTVIGLLMLLAAPILAQSDSHPEYAGTWKLNYKRGNYRPKNEVPQTVDVTVSGPTIEFRLEQEGKTLSDRKYTVDGNQHPLPESADSRSYYTAEWKGGKDDVLEIESYLATRVDSDYLYHSTITWNLSPNRRVLVYRLVAPGLNTAMKVYDKQ